MKHLVGEGKEGALRAQYVEQLEDSEKQLKQLTQQEKVLKIEIEKLHDVLEKLLSKTDKISL